VALDFFTRYPGVVPAELVDNGVLLRPASGEALINSGLGFNDGCLGVDSGREGIDRIPEPVDVAVKGVQFSGHLFP